MVVDERSSAESMEETPSGARTGRWGYLMPMPGVKIYLFLEDEGP